MSTIGERVRAIREEENLTQKEFADSLGVTQAQISAIERNISNPSLTLVKLICRLYAASEEWILAGEERQYPSDGETDDARTRIEIRTIDNSLFTELYIDGHRVDGVRGFKLEQTATIPARLTVDLSYLDVAIDQQCVLYSKSPDRKIKEIIWAKESE